MEILPEKQHICVCVLVERSLSLTLIGKQLSWVTSSAFSWNLLSRGLFATLMKLLGFVWVSYVTGLPQDRFFFFFNVRTAPGMVVVEIVMMISQVWWLRSVIAALRKLRQGDREFESSLDCLARPCLNNNHHHSHNSSNSSKSQCFNYVTLVIYINTDTW